MKKSLSLLMLLALLAGVGHAQDQVAGADDGGDDSALVDDFDEGDESDEGAESVPAGAATTDATATTAPAPVDNPAAPQAAKAAGKGKKKGGKKKGRRAGKGKKKAGKQAAHGTQKARRRRAVAPGGTYKQLMMAINRHPSARSFAMLLRATGLNRPLRNYDFVKSDDAVRGKLARSFLSIIPRDTDLTVFAPRGVTLEPLIEQLLKADRTRRGGKGKEKEDSHKKHAEVLEKIKKYLMGYMVKGRYAFADLPNQLPTLAGTMLEPKSFSYGHKDIQATNGILHVMGSDGDVPATGGKRSPKTAFQKRSDKIKAHNQEVLAREKAHHDAMTSLAHKNDAPAAAQANEKASGAPAAGGVAPADSAAAADGGADDAAADDGSDAVADVDVAASPGGAMPGTDAVAHG